MPDETPEHPQRPERPERPNGDPAQGARRSRHPILIAILTGLLMLVFGAWRFCA